MGCRGPERIWPGLGGPGAAGLTAPGAGRPGAITAEGGAGDKGTVLTGSCVGVATVGRVAPTGG